MLRLPFVLARVAAIAGIVAGMAGCRQIEAPGLLPVEENKAALQARSTPPPLSVAPTDFIELRTAGSDIPITITLRMGACGTPTDKPDLVFTPLARPRLPVSVLKAASLVISGPTIVDLCAGGKNVFNADPSALSPWTDAAVPFQAHGLEPALVRDPPRRVLPGDDVLITGSWQDGKAGNFKPQVFAYSQVRERVDRDGRLRIPLLSAPMQVTVGSPPPFGDPAAGDRIGTSSNTALSLVRVWLPDRPYTSQPLLQNVEQCLSRVQLVPPIGVPDGDCSDAWIDPTVFSPGQLQNQQRRYRLEPIQYWTAVFEHGEHFRLRYEPGETINAAVQRLMLREIGQPLLRDGSHLGGNATYVTVVPREELGGELARPFWYALRVNSEHDNLMLLPGDVVFLTRTKPKATL